MIIQKIFKIKYVYRRTLGKNEYKYEKTSKDLKNEPIDLETVILIILILINKKGNLCDMLGRICSEKG